MVYNDVLMKIVIGFAANYDLQHYMLYTHLLQQTYLLLSVYKTLPDL